MMTTILALQFLVLGIAALLLYKVRRLHIASIRAFADLEAVRGEAEVLFHQIQALFALERKLQLREALPPMRGWAGSPDFLLALAEEVIARSPHTLVECSSGVSTIVSARCMQMNGIGHVYSLEHDPVYAEKTRALLSKYQLSEWATVIDAPLVKGPSGMTWYSEEGLPLELDAIDMLIVDGPPAGIGRMARLPALPTLLPRLAKKYVVLVDDADRPDEREMVRRWCQDDPSLAASYVACEKGLCVLEGKRSLGIGVG